MRFGWTEKPTEELLPYYSKKFDIITEDVKLIWNDRVIIPASLREILLNDLHAEHLGIVKAKQLARKYVWWPMIDQDVESKVKECVVCQETAKKPSNTHNTQNGHGLWDRGNVCTLILLDPKKEKCSL